MIPEGSFVSNSLHWRVGLENSEIELQISSTRAGSVNASDGLLQVQNQGVSEAFQLEIKLRSSFASRYSLAKNTLRSAVIINVATCESNHFR